MSLTILFQTPVDTGMAKIRTEGQIANLLKHYLTCPQKPYLAGYFNF